MSDRVSPSTRLGSVTERSERISGVGRLIVLAFGLVGVSIGFALIEPSRAEPFVLGLLGILSAVGIVTLLASAVGLIRFSVRSQSDDIGKALIESTGEGVLITDREGRIVYANRTYVDLLGATADRDVRSVERAFSASTEASEAIYRISQRLRDGQSSKEEIRLPGPLGGEGGADAGPRWYRIQARPLAVGPRGRQVLAWIVADISEERARQETVFQELQHAIDYLDHAPAGFFSAEPDGRIVYLNATLAEWLGIDLAGFAPGTLTLADVVRGDVLALLTPPSDLAPNRTAIIDLDLIKRNGQSLPVRLLHRVPVAADGAPGATRTIVLNRSPGEDVSEALRAAEVRFTRFFNNTPMAIAALDHAGRIGRTNAAFVRLFGVSQDEAGAKRLVDLVREADRPKLEDALRQAEAGRRRHRRRST